MTTPQHRYSSYIISHLYNRCQDCSPGNMGPRCPGAGCFFFFLDASEVQLYMEPDEHRVGLVSMQVLIYNKNFIQSSTD